MPEKRGQLIVFSGPSGVGKGTILAKYMQGRSDICYSVSATTRAPRPGEVDGRQYFFLTRQEFEKMIEEGIISQMVTLPSNMFSSVTLPATLWFFDKHKPQTDKKNEILFIDARNVFTQVDRAHRKFSDEQIKNLGIITRLYHGDTAAFVALLAEYQEALAAAPETAEDKETKTKAYWQAQINWLTERFPDGVYRDVIGLCKAAKLDGEDGIIDQD